MDETAALLAEARALSEHLANSALYRDYRHYKTLVEGHPALAQQMQNFRQAQAELEHKRLQNQPLSFDEEKYISHLYAALTLNADASRLLDAENKLLEVYRQLYIMLHDACHIDLPF